MKVVLFCGGLGLRIRDAEDIPKPMVQIGYRPILWHAMKYYAHFGHRSSFCAWGVGLTAENGRMMYLPEGCAHGYQTLEDGTEMHYMASEFYTPSAARGVRFDDPAFGIRWPLPAAVVSEQDRTWPPFAR